MATESTNSCNCATFLDPFPTQITWRSVSSLQHYCRVCNTQLNSCKQSRIHAEGKKHEKRVDYLKFCFENGTEASEVTNAAEPTSPKMTSAPPILTNAPPPPLIPQMYPSYLHYSAPPAAFYFPAQSYHHSYPDFVAMPTAPPPNTPLGLPFGPAGYYPQPSTPVILTENQPTKPVESKKQGGYNKGPSGIVEKAKKAKSSASSMTSMSSSHHVLTCDLCSLTFPSLSVLNNHIKGSRHLRKVKSQQAYKQMKAAGMAFKQESGEIQCEVCRVSVNSSHQLQAHLAGHKHKVRCYRRGLDPSAALITPTSTPPSTAPSECSAPRSSASSKYHTITLGKSLLGMPPGSTKIPTTLKPGLLGEYPVALNAAQALRGLLPLPLPKPLLPVQAHKTPRNSSSSLNSKTKTRKVSRPGQRSHAKERRDSTTESDEATDATCVVKKEAEADGEKKEGYVSQSKGNDFSSDEAKESEGDSDPVSIEANMIETSANENVLDIGSKPVKFSCETCNLTVNSATQLSQHMSSPKHHVKAAEANNNGDTKTLKEIPMLNMFLKTLHAPSQYEKIESSGDGSNTEVER